VRSVERNEEHAGHDHAADAAHDHGGEDPHLWLEPSNARAWTAQLAEVLGRIDPENAARYAGNARDAMAELDSVEAEMAARLQPVQGVPFVVFHDSLGYLEDRFGLTSAGSIALSDATAPSARHLSDLRANVASFGARCAFSEPQFDTRLLDALAPGGMRVETLDILGSAQTPGPDLYPAMMRAMAAAMHRCLAP
jgi:zinc transport system substrate-binding protein